MTNFNQFEKSNKAIATRRGKTPSLISRIKDLMGVGPHLLLLGIILEALTIASRRWVTLPISLSFELRVVFCMICIVVCLIGMIWFNRWLNLIKVNLSATESKLVTHGPFNYVRHPLYATLLFTIPPILIACFSDLLFLFTWIVIFVISHFIVILEEQVLVRKFGEEYTNYQRFVPALIPYKGAAGRRYREYCNVSTPIKSINRTI